jgi:hypothetical protein
MQFLGRMMTASTTPPEIAAADLDFRVELTPGDDSDLNIRVVPPPGTGRRSTHLVCVVDVSGSMGTGADLPDSGERTGLSLLDVVKHALKAILHTLGPNDYFALVPFSTTAEVALPFVKMDAGGLRKALAAVEAMHPTATTNMWDGILKALDLIQSTKETKTGSAIFVFTDGVPNCVPPEGHQMAYQNYMAKNDVQTSLSCFGFGYNMDSPLLQEMSAIGGGVYSFIPDVGMVGTVFVHAVANLLSCMSSQCVVEVELADGSIDEEFLPVLDTAKVKRTRTTLQFDLGIVNYGQARDIVVRLRGVSPEPDRVTVRALMNVQGRAISARGEFTGGSSVRATCARARMQVLETLTATLLLCKDSIDNLPAALAKIGEVAETVKGAAQVASEQDDEQVETYLSDLLKDLEGQIAMALSRKDYYERWGRHFLPSVQRAHLLQQCTNFKDPGMQHYGGDVFREVRDTADDRFNELPAPVPSSPAYDSHSYGGRSAMSNFSMSNFNNAAGACFATGLVRMADGTKEISEVAAGDLVWGDDGPVRVECVVETRFTADQVVNVVDLGNGVLATPWHPVRAGGEWVFPIDLQPMATRHITAVYSLLLSDGGVFTIGGWETVALGHGLQEGKAAHAFFGSRSSVEACLRRFPGRAAGHVVLTGYDCLDRDASGLICALREAIANRGVSTGDDIDRRTDGILCAQDQAISV